MRKKRRTKRRNKLQSAQQALIVEREIEASGLKRKSRRHTKLQAVKKEINLAGKLDAKSRSPRWCHRVRSRSSRRCTLLGPGLTPGARRRLVCQR